MESAKHEQNPEPNAQLPVHPPLDKEINEGNGEDQANGSAQKPVGILVPINRFETSQVHSHVDFLVFGELLVIREFLGPSLG